MNRSLLYQRTPNLTERVQGMSPTPITPADVRAAVGILQAVAEAIRELGEVASGHLYANLQGSLTLREFGQAIETLKSAGLVREHGHLLTWLEPPSGTESDIEQATRQRKR